MYAAAILPYIAQLVGLGAMFLDCDGLEGLDGGGLGVVVG